MTKWREDVEVQQTQRRMSIRSVSLTYGIPARVVARAVSTGELPAVVTTTETGRERVYISYEDALSWFESLSAKTTTREKVRA
jgi:hypothetical protein